MSTGTIAIVTCDSESACDEWTVDYYETCASNWPELMKGWVYQPGTGRDIFCPEHAAEATAR